MKVNLVIWKEFKDRVDDYLEERDLDECEVEVSWIDVTSNIEKEDIYPCVEDNLLTVGDA